MDQPNQLNQRRDLRNAARGLALLSLGGLIVLAIASACGPFGDDEAGASGDDGPEVEMATFTPIDPNVTPEIVITQEARQTEAAHTATARAENPDAAATEDAQAAQNAPAPPIASQLPTAADGDVLTLPAAFLNYDDEQVDSTNGSFHWFWYDIENGAEISVPFIEVTDYGLSAPSGSEVMLSFEETPEAGAPEQINVTIYDWESTATIPTDEQGNQADKLYFALRPDAIRHFEGTADPNNPVIPLDLAPNQYIVYVQAFWPPSSNPDVPDNPIFVSYAFNVFVE